MENKRRALGRGLEQLFSNNVLDFNDFEKKIVNENDKDIQMIKLDEIRSNPFQPRKIFNEESLKELAESIKEHGVIQPIIVKKSIKGYELVAGERRCRAAKMAGLSEIPAIVKEFSDQEMMEIALIENIQRENLNPIEEAKCILNIIKLRKMTQEEFSTKFGKSRSYVTNLLGILNLPLEVQQLVMEKKLSASHAKILSKVEDAEFVRSIANRIITEDLSVRETEQIVSHKTVVKRKPIYTQERDKKYDLYENILSDIIGNKVNIKKDKIEISFDSLKDLERIMEILNISIGDD